jgi:hypothetical protein
MAGAVAAPAGSEGNSEARRRAALDEELSPILRRSGIRKQVDLSWLKVRQSQSQVFACQKGFGECRRGEHHLHSHDTDSN